MKNERIFLIGCGGMLGSYVYNELKNENEIVAYDIDASEDWIQYGDINNYDFIKEVFIKFNPSVVINLAAKTDLEYCEENEQEAYRPGGICSSIV